MKEVELYDSMSLCHWDAGSVARVLSIGQPIFRAPERQISTKNILRWVYEYGKAERSRSDEDEAVESKQRYLALREPHGQKKIRNATDLLSSPALLTVSEDA